MTISSTIRTSGPYTGNGVTTAFAFSFKVFAASDLYVVRLNTATLVETVLVLTTDYTVTLNTNQNSNPGGTVTMVTAPSSTQKITITSALGNLQPTDITNQGGFYPSVINDSLDRATIQIQQIADDVGRSLTIPLSSSGVDTDIPYPVATTLLGWDANGTAITNYTITDVLTVAGSSGFSTQTFSGTGSQTAFTLSAQPGTVANLEVFVAGVRQIPSTDYSVSGVTLTFVVAPLVGTNNIFCRWGTTLGIGTPSDGSVTPAKLSTGGPSWDASGNLTATGNVITTGQVFSSQLNAGGTVAGGVYTLTSNLSNTAGASATKLFWNNNGFSATNASISFFSSASTIPNEFRIAQYANAPMTFYTNGTERLRMSATGEVTAPNSIGIGYGLGSGGTVTQATNKNTAVTLNKATGAITMNAAALGANSTASFVLNNTCIGVNDVLIVNIKTGSVINPGSYIMWAGIPPTAGSATIYVRNISAGSLSEAVGINYTVIKGASA